MDFAILGPIEVRDQALPRPLAGLKQRILLATLIHHANQPVPQHLLIHRLWGDNPPRTAADNLRLYVYQLRRALGQNRIARSQGGYRLEIRPGELDADRFESLAEQGRTALAAGDPHQAADLLRQAVALWRGPAYADLEAVPELQDDALRLEERRLATLENRIEADLAIGDGAVLIGELLLLVGENPLRERLRGQLMTAFHLAGRQAEALSVYADARRIFAAELGLDPGPELQRLHEAILTGAPPPTGRAEPSERRALAQLPPDVGDFTGRTVHVKKLTALLGPAGKAVPDRRPVTVSVIAGMGGIGKTALAVHTAHRLSGAFRDGQLYVNLRGAEADPADPAQVLGRFLTVLGVSGPSIPESLDDRAALYRSHLAHRRVLIVLDNAASETQVRPLLPGTAGCAVLLTSRTRLTGLEGAALIDLDVLSPGHAVELLARIAGPERVAAEPQAAGEIVALCGHIPLAVRIAGARLAARPHRNLASFAHRLRDEHSRLDHLATGDLAVRASLALSYVGLAPRTRMLFRRLGLLQAPDFAAWVAAALLDVPYADGEAEIEALVDAQLLTVSGTDASGQMRYRFHDLLRIYARECAELEETEPERERALVRAFGAWLALAERAMERVPGPCYAVIHGTAPRHRLPGDLVDELLADSVAWFDAERIALQAAIGQACAMRLDEFAWDLAGCLERYLDVRGFFGECRQVNEQVIRVCRETDNRLGHAVMLRGLTDITTWVESGHEGDAMGSLHTRSAELVRLFAEIGEMRGLSDAHVMCAWGLAGQGLTEQALESGRLALRLAEESGHLAGQARAQLALGVANGLQHPEVTLAHLDESLRLARPLGNRRFESTIHQFIGLVHSERGDYQVAHENLTRSLLVRGELHDPTSESLTLVALAGLYARNGDARARPTAEAAESLGRQYNLGHHLAHALWVLARIDLTEGESAAAVPRMEESVRLWRTRGWKSFLADALITLGRVYLANGSDADAVTVWREAGELFAAMGDHAKVSEVATLLDGLAGEGESRAASSRR
ncbi:AfsR/SARP family transcriptional regulator [Rhizohabitans arisaemae]|uniref:AfsR/SARP family transcriptional regulator n=1 Tax=Rhizohabitans arisaemae TaxID=2720610 RepID=UPI0024B0D820|nr:AfsR/SARP family transcriptional regulator [Rhizohabitans arisaemae]